MRIGQKIKISVLNLVVANVIFVGGSFSLEHNFLPEIVTSTFPVGEPFALAAGDFNGDSLPDLLLIAEANRPDIFGGIPNPNYEVRFYILIGQENRSWALPRLVTVVPAPGKYAWVSSVSPAIDIDGDGNTDLAVVLTFLSVPQPSLPVDIQTAETDLFLFWGQGDGSFTVEHNARLGVGFLPPSVITVGDFNGDKLIDLAYPDPQNLSVQIMFNKGARNFSEPHIVQVAGEEDECMPIPGILATAKLIEESVADSLVILGPCKSDHDSYEQFIRFLWPDGDEAWKLSPVYKTGIESKKLTEVAGNLLVGEYDGDGHVDLIFTKRLSFSGPSDTSAVPGIMGVYLLRGDGKGTFATPMLIGGVFWGKLLSVQYKKSLGWNIITLSSDENAVQVVIVKPDSSYAAFLSIPIKGYVVDGIVVDWNNVREVVVISSLDLKSEVIVVQVIRGFP